MFGLGLKTASTAFCRKLSVISRDSSDSEALKVCWDLDYIAKTNSWSLLRSIPNEDELEALDEAAAEDHGTLVLWENVDRLFQKDYASAANARKALVRYVDSLKDHIALVYQRFLDHSDKRAMDVDIWLNDERVMPFDPFCAKEGNTVIAGECSDLEVAGDDDGEPARMTLRAYLLPRPEEFSTAKAASEARLSNDMQGFYVYRENRLIHSGSWMDMFKLEPHYSLLRVELSFDNKADGFLHVDIKKSRILLNNDLFDYIKSQFLPAPRRAAAERYRTGTKKAVAKSGSSPHEAANKTIDGKAAAVQESKTTILDPETNKVRVENKYGSVTTKIKIRTNEGPSAMRVIPVEDLESGVLWSPTLSDDGKHAVSINMAHPYYQKIYYPLLSNSVTITGMDALLWALAEAELSTFNEESKENFEDMRITTSRTLKKLIESLPEPKIEHDDNQVEEE